MHWSFQQDPVNRGRLDLSGAEIRSITGNRKPLNIKNKKNLIEKNSEDLNITLPPVIIIFKEKGIIL